MTMRPGAYQIRAATVADATLIAEHRAMMFYDMGSISEAEIPLLRDASKDWLAELLRDGAYLGWIVQHTGTAMGGAGLHLRTLGPVPGCLEVGTGAHIANVYIEPPHRRRGLARLLMNEILQWAHTKNIKEMTLMASEQARPLYRSLGFLPSAEFHSRKL